MGRTLAHLAPLGWQHVNFTGDSLPPREMDLTSGKIGTFLLLRRPMQVQSCPSVMSPFWRMTRSYTSSLMR